MSPYQFWIDLGKLILEPKQLAIGLFELFLNWLYSRHWSSLLYGIPAVGIATYMAVNSIVLHWKGPQEVQQVYWSVIEKELMAESALIRAERNVQTEGALGGGKERNDEPSNALVSSEKLSRTVNQLLLKILDVESSDMRANYLIASALGNSGRVAQARFLMRRLAPELERGFAPAHSWLAADRIQNLGVKNDREKAVLLADLAEARRWSGVQPMLLSAYVDLLLMDKKIDVAVEVLREAGARDSRLQVKLASVAKQFGNDPLYEATRKQVSEDRSQRIESGIASELDYVELASVQLLDEDFESASRMAGKGLSQFPNSNNLRRLHSNTYMMAYDKAAKKSASSEVQLGLLDQAMKSDPGNPLVLEKVAELTVDGKMTDERFSDFLRDQLASGKATAITHLLLAIGHLRQNALDKALVHLELARSLAPNNPIILNNLALCIARLQPEELPKARRMIEVALTYSGRNAELLDTYGEILMMSGDTLPAIRAFEAALSISAERPGTRKKLAEAYAKVALDDMADAVNKKSSKTNSNTNESVRSDGVINKSDDIINQNQK